MLQQHVCHKRGYSTKQIGHYNKHVQKPGTCKRKDLEHCRHCQKVFAKGGSGLRKHACRANGLLLPFNMDLSADCRRSVRFALQELQKLSKCEIEQLGLADLNPVNVAVAAIRYLHFTPLFTQSHNITLCQHHIAKFDIVQQRSGSLVWVPHLKDDVLPDLLDEAADIVEGLAQAKLPKRQMEHLHFFVRHVLRPCWKSSPSESYEDLFRRQRPQLAEQKEAVCVAIQLGMRYCTRLASMQTPE